MTGLHLSKHLSLQLSSRYFCKSAVTGGDGLRLGSVRGLALRLLEALLDTMEGARPFAHHQGGPRPPQSHHEPSALVAADTQAAGLHSCGPPDAQPSPVIALLHRQRAHSHGVGRLGGGSGDSCVPASRGYGHAGGRHEDQSHVSRHPVGCAE